MAKAAGGLAARRTVAVAVAVTVGVGLGAGVAAEAARPEGRVSMVAADVRPPLEGRGVQWRKGCIKDAGEEGEGRGGGCRSGGRGHLGAGPLRQRANLQPRDHACRGAPRSQSQTQTMGGVKMAI